MQATSSRRELLLGLAGLACVAPARAARAQIEVGDTAPTVETEALPALETGDAIETTESAATVDRPRVVGAIGIHTVGEGDSMHDLARTYGVGFTEMRAANPGVDAWAPGKGRQLILPTAHLLPRDEGHRMIVNVADMRLYWLGPEPSDVRSWPVGVGREAHETPIGVMVVTEKRLHPTWRPTPQHRKEKPGLPAAVPPGPNNPLGDHALRVGWDGYNIHGTNRPDGVGRRVSRGCIRLYPEDIEELFGLASVGDEVRIADEPAKIGWVGGELFLEVHPTGDQIEEVVMGKAPPSEPLEDLDELVRGVAGDQEARIDWARVRSVEAERRGVPYQITKPLA